MEEKFLLQVDKNFSLPGLGVLLLPESEVLALLQLALHTALRVTLRYPSNPTESTIATVEEIARTEMPAIRGLLLAQEVAAPVPTGTEVWWTGTEASWEELV